METPAHAIVIFGASGDLTRRKLVPALAALAGRAELPDGFAVVGVGRSESTDDAFRSDLIDAAGDDARDVWREVASRSRCNSPAESVGVARSRVR